MCSRRSCVRSSGERGGKCEGGVLLLLGHVGVAQRHGHTVAGADSGKAVELHLHAQAGHRLLQGDEFLKVLLPHHHVSSVRGVDRGDSARDGCRHLSGILEVVDLRHDADGGV